MRFPAPDRPVHRCRSVSGSLHRAQRLGSRGEVNGRGRGESGHAFVNCHWAS